MGLQDSLPGTYIPRSTGGHLVTISHNDDAVHQGQVFHVTHSVGHGTATTASVLITPGASVTHGHLSVNVSADKGGKWTLQEAPNTTGGSALVAYNANRNSVLTSGTVFAHTPTLTSAGTIIDRGIVGAAGGNPTSVTGGAGRGLEWELKPSTKYLVVFTADNATTVTHISLTLDVEHT